MNFLFYQYTILFDKQCSQFFGITRLYGSCCSRQWTQIFIVCNNVPFIISFLFNSTSSLPTGWTISDNILSGVDTYLTASTCLNQSTNIFLQPSPFEAVELIVYTLKYSQQPVDILVLGPFTNLAAAIIRDRSIVPKIGTLYISG
jgi:hypothetical protein